MKANELRLGNIIKPIGDFPYWKVSSKDILYIENNPNEYEPIPLTEDWLVKLGFKRVKNQWNDNWVVDAENGYKHSVKKYREYKSQPFEWVYNNDETDAGCYSIKTIEFVHQLQNLYFALTGEELKIINSD